MDVWYGRKAQGKRNREIVTGKATFTLLHFSYPSPRFHVEEIRLGTV